MRVNMATQCRPLPPPPPPSQVSLAPYVPGRATDSDDSVMSVTDCYSRLPGLSSHYHFRHRYYPHLHQQHNRQVSLSRGDKSSASIPVISTRTPIQVTLVLRDLLRG